MNNPDRHIVSFDVLPVDPPSADHLLRIARGCLVSPHLAWDTRAARRRLFASAVDNVAAFLADDLHHFVN